MSDVTLRGVTDIGGRASRRRQERKRQLIRGGTALGALAAVGLVVGTVVLITREDEPSTAPAARSDRATTSSTLSTTTTTFVVPSTPVPRSSNPVVALAQQYDGYYTGTWQNSTSGTTGPASLELRIDPNANTLATATQLDGDFFGGGASEFGRLEATINIGDPTAPVTVQTERLGAVTARLDGSLALVVEALDVPDNNVKSFTLRGGLRADMKGFDSTFAITFENGSTAEGTIAVTCSPERQRPSQVTTLCSL
jgi:hypothetical protein